MHTKQTTCKNCGTILEPGQKFCTNCGTKVDEQPIIETSTNRTCPQCHAPIEDNQPFCTNCGTKLKEEPQKKTINKKIIIIAVAIIIGITLIFTLIKPSKPNFEKIYKNHCDESWAYLSRNKDTLSLDTNPYDIEGYELTNIENFLEIKEINKDLELPSELFDQMGETTSYDGIQTRTYKKQNVSVQWQYNPRQGLEIIYHKIK